MSNQPKFNRTELSRMWKRTPRSCECVHCQSKIASNLLLAVLDAVVKDLDRGQQCLACGASDWEGHIHNCPVKACIDAGLAKPPTGPPTT